MDSPQSWNRYSYVGNNPILKNDPTGHWPNLSISGSTVAKIALGVAGVAITAAACAATAGIGCIVAAAIVSGASSYGNQVIDNVQKNGKLDSDAFTKNIDAKRIAVDTLIGGLSAGAGLAAGKIVGATVCTSGAAGLCRYAAAAAAGAITGGGVQTAANIHDGDPSTKPLDNVLASSWKGASYGVLAYGARTGDEITISKNLRIAPFGNRRGNEYGELPHYHQRYIDPETGGTVPGGGIGRHRPWE